MKRTYAACDVCKKDIESNAAMVWAKLQWIDCNRKLRSKRVDFCLSCAFKAYPDLHIDHPEAMIDEALEIFGGHKLEE